MLFLMSWVRMLHILKDWWKFIQAIWYHWYPLIPVITGIYSSIFIGPPCIATNTSVHWIGYEWICCRSVLLVIANKFNDTGPRLYTDKSWEWGICKKVTLLSLKKGIYCQCQFQYRHTFQSWSPLVHFMTICHCPFSNWLERFAMGIQFCWPLQLGLNVRGYQNMYYAELCRQSLR